MKRYVIPVVVVIIGVALAIIARYLLPQYVGLTTTSNSATHFLGLNIIGFWFVLILAMIVGAYLYLRHAS